MYLGLGFGGLSDFPAAKSSMELHLDTMLISPQYVSVAYPGFQRGVLGQAPYKKWGGGGGGGGGASGPIYEKWEGGGGGGGAIPLQVRYLWAHRKYQHVPT